MTQLKLYYQGIKGVAFDNFCSDAAIGARDAGIETEMFEDINTLRYSPHNIIVGSVEDTQNYLGCNIPSIDHSWADHFLDRKSTVINSISDIPTYPVFIKPESEIKAFTGFVAESEDMAKRLSYNFAGEIKIQDVIDIESEYRVYVSNLKGIIGIKHYLGDPYLPLNKKVVEGCFKESRFHLKEASYTLDFGITKSGKTFLIEINDGWAIGNYGLSPKLYYHFIKDRFLQITGVTK